MINRLKSLFSSKEDKKQDEEVRKVHISFKDEIAVKHLSKLQGYGVSIQDIGDTYQRLNGKERDVIWSLYNKLLSEMNQNRSDIQSQICCDMAEMLYQEGKAFKHLLERGMQYSLKSFKEADIPTVEILSDRTNKCKVASELDGQRFSLEEALKSNPIPSDKCEGFCNCIYLPVTK